jgi:hypothetical protein
MIMHNMIIESEYEEPVKDDKPFTMKVLYPNLIKCWPNLQHFSPCIKKFTIELNIIIFGRISKNIFNDLYFYVCTVV